MGKMLSGVTSIHSISCIDFESSQTADDFVVSLCRKLDFFSRHTLILVILVVELGFDFSFSK